MMSDFVLLFQIFLEVLHLFGEKCIHFHFLLDDVFKFINVRIHIIVHEANTLNLGDKLTFLSEQLGIFLDGSHMRGKDLLLFLKNITNLFLEGKELLILLVPHGPLHGIKIILDFLFIFLFGLFLNLNLLIDDILFSRTILVGLFLLDCFLRGLLGLVGLEVLLFVGV
jgi:hypothetical protein